MLTPERKCVLTEVFEPGFLELLRLVPRNPLVRALVLRLTGQLPPAHCTTYVQLEDWIKWHCERQVITTRAQQTGRSPGGGIRITVDFTEMEYGRASYSVRRSGTDEFPVNAVELMEIIQDAIAAGETPFPKASNRRVLTPYSGSMKHLLQQGYKPKLRPSGHDISDNFSIDNGAAIPPNLIALANTESNSAYLRYCEENTIKPHPARFPADLPEFFVRMLTEENDLVVDPFAGSCVTGQVCESLHRRFICCEIGEEYLRGAVHRFDQKQSAERRKVPVYSLNHPAALWNGIPIDALLVDGGRQRSKKHAPSTTSSISRGEEVIADIKLRFESPLTVRVGYPAPTDFAEILNKVVIAPLFTQVRPQLQGRFDCYTETN